MKRFLTICLTLICCLSLTALVRAQGAPNKQKKEGVVFKVPDGVFPMDWKDNGFIGFLFLRKESPSGIFVTYPNEGEKIEDLRERAAGAIAPMFLGAKEEKKIKFEVTSIPNHPGDAGDSARYYAYSNKKSVIQILLYDRTANGKSLIYGYFAMKNKKEKADADKSIWADEKGQGVEIFETFWKTLSE